MYRQLLFILLAAIGIISCSAPQQPTAQLTETDNSDDRTIYGLACDGCNDTIVLFLRLPYDGGDPDTLNILEAVKNRQIMGRPHIGDKLAIVPNLEDSTKADLVIVTEQLLSHWCYLVYPTLHHRADMAGDTDRQRLAQLPDSIKSLLNVPQEYNMDIRRDNIMLSYGDKFRPTTSDEESPVEYPAITRYNEWRIFNGRLIMTVSRKDSTDQRQVVRTDTADILLLTGDSLQLNINGTIHNYYRKAESTTRE